ncbi:capsular polysaccharide biosynthesis protein [Roseobacter cerasinus]|uniref:Capsular polysaccharide biosynthesis protein n=1 Tax=Roseobacter cerasinus TaxID=2602289 RepID=A0A640VUY6_9RHOB|nr:capsular polysaccharide biosynthesis protein [Roseobacter cerasinus]
MFRKMVLLWVGLTLAACAQSDGPTPAEVRRDARAADVLILELAPDVIAALGTPKPPEGFVGFSSRSFVPGAIQPGDVIAVRVFEPSEDGVLSVVNSTALDLGEFVVSPAGTVMIPFVGHIRVAGNSVSAAQNTITQRLRENAIEPQAAVNIQVSPKSAFTVQGNVPQGGLFPLSARGERVLDAVAMAGGTQADPESTIVTVMRGSRSGRQIYAKLLSDPVQNIPLQPGDTVIVGGGGAKFIADGALNSTGEFDFVEGELSLSQAVAKAGGLQSARANPGAVFLFRRQPPGEFFRYRERSGTERNIYGDVIFRADFDSPTERLTAQQFFLRDGDVLYVGNAALANFSKYFQIFNTPPEVPAPSLP